MDIYRRIKGESNEITFTTKVIITITFLIALVGTLIYVFVENSDVITGFFQIMTASTTAGFNTVDLSKLSNGVLFFIIFAMVIGASPSGTGGGIKTTSLSIFLGVVSSLMRGHPDKITFLKRAIPRNRMITAFAHATSYILVLSMGILLVCIFSKHSFLEICFEVASALGTVGLSLGITSNLNNASKVILTVIMFLGRLGPLTLGIALFHTKNKKGIEKSDLAI